MKRIKRVVLALSLVFVAFGSKANTNPDEGMWLPMLINKNYDEMKKIGFKLSADDIYNVNHSSLKDAIVSMGFCTGEMISKEGLMLTNHHCGYSSIQYNSSVEHDYLTDGFWAKSKDQELKAPAIVASFLVRMEDVTAKILLATKDASDTEKEAKLKEAIKALTTEATKGTIYEADIKDVFGTNQYLMFVYERYRDVRLVGAPPESVGKFGGDTDNWMWPRHTGDFSMFRVYMSKDGKPAAYSKDNVPYQPKRHLSISLKGYKEGDFSMVMGYPGRTNRYAFSRELQNAVDQVNPALIKLNGKKLALMKADMDKDLAVRIKLASNYASLANSWKYYIGQNEGLKKLNVISGKQALEKQFTAYANSSEDLKTAYANVMTNTDKLYDDYKPYVVRGLYLSTAGMSTVSVMLANSFKSLGDILIKTPIDTAALNKQVQRLKANIDGQYKDYVPATDQKIFAALLTIYYEDIPADQQPAVLAEIIKKYKAKTAAASFEKFAAEVFKRSIFTSKERAAAFLADPTAKAYQADLLVQYINKMMDFRNTYMNTVMAINAGLAKEKKAYIAGLLAMDPTKLVYPDANSTMRVSYGKVAGYTAKDAVVYNYYTTERGLLEKYNPADEEFVLPTKLVSQLKQKDFGMYANEKGELPISFLTDNDITGGNSGSPVINGNGELIGAAYDGNWEAMTGDLVFDKNFKRTIVADIRYILFIVDKYAGATNLINEMTLVK